jgi:hypothetical protein
MASQPRRTTSTTLLLLLPPHKFTHCQVYIVGGAIKEVQNGMASSDMTNTPSFLFKSY